MNRQSKLFAIMIFIGIANGVDSLAACWTGNANYEKSFYGFMFTLEFGQLK